MKSKSKWFYVHHVEDCTPKLKRFKSKSSALKFIEKIKEKKSADNDSNWFDFLIEGKLVAADDYYKPNKRAKL